MIFNFGKNIDYKKGGKDMYEMDKLLRFFDLQSQEAISPDKMISILGLLNLLSIVSIANEDPPSFSRLEAGVDSLDGEQIGSLLSSLKSDSQADEEKEEGLENLLGSDSAVNAIMSLLSGGQQGSSRLDPNLLLKLMNLFGQLRSRGQKGIDKNREKKESETNEPVKTEPYEKKEKE